MFINVKSRLDDPDIQELIEYSVFPDPDQLDTVIESYRTEDTYQLYGYESEGEVVGIIGFQTDHKNKLTIRHLAVRPDCRGAGFGRGLILEVIALIKPDQIIAETDEEAVDFYRAIGFEIASLGETRLGIERYRCTYDVDADI